MNLFSFCIALFLAGVALAIAVILLYFILSPLFGAFNFSASFRRIKKSENKLKIVNSLIDSRDFDKALKNLKNAAMLEKVAPKFLMQAKSIHQEFLSCCLEISEAKNREITNLVKLEHLLMQRVELFGLLGKAEESYRSVKSRRKEAGKEVPAWSKSDFESKIVTVKEELDENLSKIKKELEILFNRLEGNEETVVYH
jgi:hypothetical protein